MRRGFSVLLSTCRFVVLAEAIAMNALPTAQAGTTWDGGGGNTNFTTQNNWDDNLVPSFTGGTSTLTFATGGATATVDTASDLARIVLNRDAAFTIANGAGSLTLQGETVDSVVTGITAGPATAGTTVAYSISEQIALGQTQSWNVANNGAGTTSLAVSGVISGAAGLTKLGSGTLSLSGANTFSGTLTVAEGVLSVASWNNRNANGVFGNSASNIVLGTPTTTGTLRFTNTSTIGGGGQDALNRGLTIAAGGAEIQVATNIVQISGTSVDGSGQLTLNTGLASFNMSGNVNSPFTGPIRVQSGVLRTGFSTSGTFTPFGSGAITIDSGAFMTLFGVVGTPQATLRIGSLAGGGTVQTADGGSHLTTGADGTNTNFSGVITGTNLLNLTKEGAGTQILSGNNTYWGATTVSGGTLQAASDTALGFGGMIGSSAPTTTTTVSNAATLDLSGVTVNEAISLSTGSLINSNTSTASTLASGLASSRWTNGGSGYNDGLTGTAAITVTGGGGSGATATGTFTSGTLVGVQITNAGSGYTSAPTLTLPGAGASANQSGQISSLALTGTSNQIGGDGNLTIAAVMSGASGGFAKVGGGTLTLSASNTYTGGIRVNAGTLRVDNANALATTGTITFGGGVLKYSVNNNTDYSARIAGSQSAIAIDTDGRAVVFGSALANTNVGGLTKSGSGSLALNAANLYSGATTIKDGTLALGLNGSFGSSPTITVGDTGSSGAVLDITAKTGTFTFVSSQTVGGIGTIKMDVGDTARFVGILAPGNSAGILTFDGGTALLSGTTQIEFFGAVRGTGYDAIDLINSAAINYGNGVLALDFGSWLADTQSYQIFGNGSQSPLGNFSEVTIAGDNYTGLTFSGTNGVWTSQGTIPSGQTLTFTESTGTLVIVPEPGAIALIGAGAMMAALRVARRRRSTLLKLVEP